MPAPRVLLVTGRFPFPVGSLLVFQLEEDKLCQYLLLLKNVLLYNATDFLFLKTLPDSFLVLGI